MGEYESLEHRLNAEVNNRDAKIEAVYRKMDSHYQTLDRKIDGVVDKITEMPALIYRRKTDNGARDGSIVKSVSVVFIILVPFLTLIFGFGVNVLERLDDKVIDHSNIEAHPEALKQNAQQTSVLESHKQQIQSLYSSVERFERERMRIEALEKNVSSAIVEIKWIKEALRKSS